jgi:hypothetical protein
MYDQAAERFGSKADNVGSGSRAFGELDSGPRRRGHDVALLTTDIQNILDLRESLCTRLSIPFELTEGDANR